MRVAGRELELAGRGEGRGEKGERERVRKKRGKVDFAGSHRIVTLRLTTVRETTTI